MTRKILVTGASSFIGRFLINALVEGPDKIIATYNQADDLPENCEWRRLDLFKESEVKRLMQEIQPTHLIHLAWFVKHDAFWDGQENLDWLIASLKLLKSFAEHGGERFIGIGSCAEYSNSSRALNEFDSECVPSSLYSASKLSLFEILKNLSPVLGLEWAWCRLFNVVGPGEPKNKLISSAIRSFKINQVPELKTPQAIRDFIDVRDVAQALVLIALSRSQGPINIGTGKGTAISVVVDRVSHFLGIKPLDRKLRDREFSTSGKDFVVADTKRLNVELGFTPNYTLSEMIKFQIEEIR